MSKLGQILDVLVLDLDSAAQHFYEVGYDVAFEDTDIVGLEAVEYLAAARA